MVQKETKLKCKCCGLTFWTEYYHGGSIEHDNYTNDRNMNIIANQFKTADDEEKYRLFLDSITLDENLCNMKDHTYKVGMQVFECRLKWFGNNGHNEIVEYLETNRKNIKSEFNKVTNAIIAEKMEEVKNMRKRLAK
jgi:hypothetical protein